MPDLVCKHCQCNEIDEDATRGDKVCTNCGAVLEEQLIVSEIQFQENAAGGASVMGQFVSLEGMSELLYLIEMQCVCVCWHTSPSSLHTDTSLIRSCYL